MSNIPDNATVGVFMVPVSPETTIFVGSGKDFKEGALLKPLSSDLKRTVGELECTTIGELVRVRNYNEGKFLHVGDTLVFRVRMAGILPYERKMNIDQLNEDISIAVVRDTLYSDENESM